MGRGLRAAAVLGAAAALALVPSIPAVAATPAHAHVREYWVAAVPVDWNVVPNGRDVMEGTRYAPSATRMRTVVYRRYSAGFRHPVADRDGVGAGNASITGPLLRARVGDRLVVHFKNLDTLFRRRHSMHFHGVRYTPGSDGSFVPGFSGPGADVAPGHSFTYRLTAAHDSAGVWPYHDHSPSMDDSIAGGMYGALSILGRHEKAPDREFLVFFEHTGDFMTIDGRAFLGNTPVFHARVGDRVQWDVLALGDDFHTFHVHGHRWMQGHTPRDTRTIGPAESFRVGWREEDPGTWLYHCHVESHMMDGMIGLYRVARR